MNFPIIARIACPILVFVFMTFITPLLGQEASVARALPVEAKVRPSLGSDGVKVYARGQTLWLALDDAQLKKKKAQIPRVCAPIRSIRWQGEASKEIKFWPEVEHWEFSWKQSPEKTNLIEVVFDRSPVLPSDCPPATSAGDGSVMLHAYQASTFGEKLRFEPQWFKNTVGYWTIASDYATWKLNLDQPGTYSVAVLQGCGTGQGGSDAVITLQQGDDTAATLDFQTVDTGHFQNFRWNHLGMINVSEGGDYELRIAPKRIAKNALFDVRTIHLVKQAQAGK